MKPRKRRQRRLKMKTIKRILTLHCFTDLSYRQIGEALMIPYTTVADYIRRYKKSNLSPGDLKEKNDRDLYQILFGEEIKRKPGLKLPPDFACIHQELKKKHVTRLLLWEDYREIDPDGYGYSQFCELYNRWAKKLNISMRQVHRAGEKMFVDYSGLTMEIIDPLTGVVKEAEILEMVN